MTDPQRLRWYGDPAEPEQPDVGDVLGYVPMDRPDWWHLVHRSAPVRGRGAADLWLWVTRLDFGPDGSIPPEVVDVLVHETGRYFHAERRKPVRRRIMAP